MPSVTRTPRSNRRRPEPAPVRIHVKRIDEIDPTKVAFAFWMLAERLVKEENQKEKQKK